MQELHDGDEIAMLRLEIDAVKIQHWEKENKTFDNIEIVKGKNDDLQKAIKTEWGNVNRLYPSILSQFNTPTAENTMLNSKLENEK